MSCLTASERADIEAKIVKLDAQIVEAEVAYSNSLAGIKSSKLDTGEAMQWTQRFNPTEILTNIRYLEGKRDQLRRRLDGRAISRVVSVRF